MNFAAIILVLCSSVALAFVFIRKEIRHCAVLSEAIQITEYIGIRAFHFNEPLSEILKAENCEVNKYFGKLCVAFEKEIKSDIVPVAWANAIKQIFSGVLEDYECDVLIHFGEKLCSCSSFEIENIKSNAVSDLEELRKTALENKNSKSKSTAAVTVSAGVIIVLMFA